MMIKGFAKVLIASLSTLFALALSIGFAQPAMAAGTTTPGSLSATASAVNPGEVALTWNATTSPTNIVAGYDIWYSTTNNLNTTTSPATVTLATNSKTTVAYTITGLTPGASYYFSVRVNAASKPNNTDSAWSSAVGPIKTTQTLVAPTAVAVTASGAAATAGVSVSWTASSNAAAAQTYKVLIADNALMTGATTYTGKTSPFTGATGLTAATTYYATVTAEASTGYLVSPASVVSAGGVATQTISAPTAPTVSSGGSALAPAITITWATPSNAAAGQTYSVKVYSNIGLTTQVGSTLTNQTSPIVFNSGLTTGTSYWVTVSAEATSGFLASAASSAGTGLAATNLATPAAPTVVSGSSAGTLTVTFTANPSATSSTVRIYSDAGLTVLVGSAYANATSGLAISGLTPGATYYVTVTSIGNGSSIFDSVASPSSSARTKSALTITVDAKSITYGSGSPASGFFTYTITGWLNSETALTAAGFVAPTCASAGYAQGNAAATTSQISCTGSSATNYVITQVGTALLTVGKAVLTVAPNSQTVVYGQVAPATSFYTFGVTGWVLSQTAANAAGYVAPVCNSTYVANATFGAGVRTGVITCSGGSATNYSFDFAATANLQVDKAVLTVTPNAQTISYGATAPTYTFVYSGFVNSESSASVTFTTGLTAPVCTAAYAPSNVWSVAIYSNAITCSGGVANNYTFVTTAKANITVIKAIITIYGCARISPATCSPDQPNQVLNVVYGDSAVASYRVANTPLSNGDSWVVEAGTGKTLFPVCTSSYSQVSHAGTIQVTCSADAGSNYTLVVSAGTIVVAKKTLAVSAQAASVTYGQAATGLTATIAPTLNNEPLTAPPVCTSIYVAGNAVGNYPITCTIATQTDYILDASGPQGVLTVNIANLVITANSGVAKYGDAKPTHGFSAPAKFSGDNWLTSPICDSTYSQGANIGTYPVTCSGGIIANSANYSISYVVGNLAVSARTLTVTAKAVTLVYGSAVPTLWDFTVTGFYASETWATSPSGVPICSSSYATNTHVGNSYVITCSGGNAGANYSVVPVANTLRVTARPVKIIATAVTVTYGDTAVFTSTNQAVSGFAESGLMSGDAFTYQPSCSVSLYTNKKDAGTYPNAINCSGAFNSDYDISYDPATLQIDQRSVVVTANLHSLTYGDAVPTYLYATSNLLSGDSLGTITCSSSYTVSTPVSLSPLAITCSGAVNANYSISYAANRTVTLAKQPVTVTYNGSIFYGAAAPSYQASVTGLRNGDSLVPTPTCSSTYFQFAGSGNYPVACDRGVVSENYLLSVIDGVLEVKKRVVNLQATLPTIGAVKKITYGDQAPEYGYSIAANSLILGEGFVNGESFESLQRVPSCTSSYVAKADVRSYLVVCTVGALDNYTVVTSTDSFEVTPRSLTIQPLPMTITYGDVLQPFTPSVTGFLLGDGFSTAPICGLDSANRPSVGTQPINCEVNGAVVRGQLKNYLVTFNTATLTVIKKLITVTANSFQNVLFYDNAPTYGFTAKGLESGDSITGNNVCTSTYFKGAVASLVAYETSCVIADQANYEITALPGTLLVGKKSVQIKAANPTLVYGDDASNTSPVITGVVSGFPLSAQPVCVIQGYSRVSPVGTYSVQCSLAEQQNYSIGYVVGSATVTKRDLELVAPSKNISYSSNLPLLKVDGFGFVNDDLLTVEPTCSVLEAPNKLYSTRTPVGSYVVRCSGAVNNNYLISYTDGTLTVDRKAITVKAPNLSVSVGSAPPAYVATAVGFANGDTFDVQPNCSSTYSSQDPRGDYAITCSGGSLTNYRISSYEPGLLLSRYSTKTLDSLVIGGRNSLAGGSWNVPFGTKKVTVSYVLSDPSSRASIGDLNLEVGANVIRVTVTADDETQNEYSVTITVDEPSLVARPVSVKAGSSVVTLNGTSLSVPIIASSSNGSVSLSATGWGVSFIVASASGTVQPLDGTNLLASTGDSVAISLRGYLPHSIVNVYLMSDPVLLGSFEVDASGSVLALVSLPQNVVFGAHSLQLNGVSDDGATVRSASIALTIKSLFVLQKALPFTATSAKLSASVSKAIASIAKAAKNGKGILVQLFATVQGKASAKDTKLAKNRAASMAAVIAAFKKAGLKAIYVPNTGTGAQTGSKSVKVQVSVSYKA